MKNTALVRNFIIFAVILAAGVVALGYHTFKSSRDIRNSDQWVDHTEQVIMRTQDLMNTVIRTISHHRSYLMMKEDAYLKSYEETKSSVSAQIATLRELTRDSVSQSTRFNEIEHLLLQLKDTMDGKIAEVKLYNEMPDLDEMEEISAARDNILRVANDALQNEYKLLFEREKRITNQIDDYQLGIFIGAVTVSIIILIFNWYLLQAQSRVSIFEASLKESEERMRLAIRGSNDGIFDWNFKTHQIYWSSQYKAMLGYQDDELKGNEDTFRKLLHPEDSELFWETFNNYINGSLTDFSCIYRMVHKEGHPVWIHGRGKALFDENGNPQRFIGAHTDISYLKEHEKQLKEERDRAEKASEAKGEFLAHMSHEIRTPLTAISGIAEILNQPGVEMPTHFQKLIKTLKTSTESLKELITDILDFSKIESGEIDLHNQSFQLGEMFQQVISIMSVRANEKKLDFSFDYEGLKNTAFYGDKQRMRQILINLIGNAVKFTEEGHVRAKAFIEPVGDSHVLRIDVEDSGIGITPVALQLIFDKFRQADSSVSRRYGGTGLGLPISKSLAEIMGGTIQVKSTVGKGSVFTVLLPFKSMLTTQEVDMEEVVRNEELNIRLKSLINEDQRILMVEDYEGNIVVLSYILNSLNCKFDIARTGFEAVQRWKQRHYDLIIMDIQMPEMDGLTATRTIRNMEDEQSRDRTPIIGLTAHALVADQQKCIESGMDDYLSKPIVENDLKAAMLNQLEKKPGSTNQALSMVGE